jgi:hypothetical protein
MKAHATKSDKVEWLLANPAVWEGYPKPKQPHCLDHHEIIFRAMKRAGLYARNVTAIECDLSHLINLARRRRAQLQTA